MRSRASRRRRAGRTCSTRSTAGRSPLPVAEGPHPHGAKSRGRATDAFTSPAEGRLVVPYAMSLLAKAPHPNEGTKVLDPLMSDEGQAIWGNPYLRPVRAKAISQ